MDNRIQLFREKLNQIPKNLLFQFSLAQELFNAG